MSKRLKRNLLCYGITAAIGLGMAALVLATYDFGTLTTQVARYRLLADAFTIPGTVILCAGLLVWISNQEMFLGIGYAVRYAVHRLIPGMGAKQERYYDYVERKREKGPVTGYGFLLITGAAFLAVAAVFMVLFYQVY